MLIRIKELRERRGLTQEQLAELIGTTKQQLGRLEKGTRPLSNEWIEKIAGTLEVRPGELFNDFPEELEPKAQSLVDAFRHLPAEQQDALLQLTRSMARSDPLVAIFDRLPEPQRGALLQLAESMFKPYEAGEARDYKSPATGTHD